jgi:3-oxoadipyl-CoA thiolase
VDAVRTPIGKHGGGLATVRPDDMAATLLRVLDSRNDGILERLDHVVLGATNQAGEDNRNIARMALLLAGLSYDIPAVTVNRLCGSGLEAVTDGVMRIWTGDADLVAVGGVESMTRSPLVMGKSSQPWSRTVPEVFDTSLGWRFQNPRMAERFPLISMGETAENVAQKWGITREEQDEFALQSHHKAAQAWSDSLFASELVPMSVAGPRGENERFEHDESVRGNATLEALARLKPVFRKGGSVTAGNSSPINDGASALLLASDRLVQELGLEPLARVESFATAGVEPNLMGEGPIPAGRKALHRAGWTPDDLDAVELNEAFAAQAIACIRGLGLHPELVNPLGGAIAIGHPIGCSGARILTTLVHHMRRAELNKGMAALCIGVGQGIALCVERD